MHRNGLVLVKNYIVLIWDEDAMICAFEMRISRLITNKREISTSNTNADSRKNVKVFQKAANLFTTRRVTDNEQRH
jgi:hypothetical protein